jgi:hypothetical protein
MATPNYDISVAEDHRIFSINIDAQWTIIGALFPTPIKRYLEEGRLAMDGYVYSVGSAWRVQDAYADDSTWYEDIAAGTKYAFPLVNWHLKSKVMAPGGSAVLVVRLVVDR